MNIKARKPSNPIIIRKGLKLGELDAEADRDLLLACFVDKGELHRLLDVNDPASIVLGRTGSGKSALLQKISESEQYSTLLDPHNISIKFLESSNIIQFLNELGVKLDLFYRMLWRHILTVEFIKLRYQLTSEDQNKSFIARINEFLSPNPARKKAFQYFSEWGNQFWLKTDEQLREITKKFSSELSGSLAGKISNLDISAKGAKSLSEEERSEVVTLATRVINDIQIQRLNEVLDFLGEYAFNDPQKRYYILIDQLDEDWAESETRCRFIKALIEETKSLRKIRQTKVISALRIDLLEIVFDNTRGAGFQEEKYESYLLPLRWSKEDLKELVDLRVREVFRRQYSSDSVDLSDIFPTPKKGGIGTAIDYITERTLLRPRDVLQFMNICFQGAADRERISWRAIFSAESIYSKKRLESLREEWEGMYPSLHETVEILRGLPSPFTRSNLQGSKFDDVIVSLSELSPKDPCSKLCSDYWHSRSQAVSDSDVVSGLLISLYQVGAIGIKISSRDTYIWSHLDQPRITKSEAKRANLIKVHKMLQQTLEIRETDPAVTEAVE